MNEEQDLSKSEQMVVRVLILAFGWFYIILNTLIGLVVGALQGFKFSSQVLNQYWNYNSVEDE